MGKFNRYRRKNFAFKAKQNIALFLLFLIVLIICVLIKKWSKKENKEEDQKKTIKREWKYKEY